MLAELLKLTIHLLFALVPLLAIDRHSLLLVLKLVLQFEDLLAEFFDLLRELTYLILIFRLLLNIVRA